MISNLLLVLGAGLVVAAAFVVSLALGLAAAGIAVAGIALAVADGEGL